MTYQSIILCIEGLEGAKRSTINYQSVLVITLNLEIVVPENK